MVLGLIKLNNFSVLKTVTETISIQFDMYDLLSN